MNGKNYESVFKNVGAPIDLFLIDDFPGHPYKVIDNSDMTELTESIKANGLLNPVIVRKKADGRYELISGHRRKRVYEILKIKKINAVVTDLNDDEAIIMMVDSNCQRSNILPSEKGFSYKMKLDAIKRQGKRTDLTLSQVEKKFNAYEELARSSGDSRNQVHRYIRLTYLVPELLEFVDNGRMKMQPAVELSYLDEEAQRDIVDIIDETDVFPSFSQTVRMRKTDKAELTYEKLSEILSEDKPNQRPTYRISVEKISQLIPREYNDRQAEKYIIEALEYYRKALNRKKAKIA